MTTTGIAEDIGANLGQRIRPTYGYYRQPDGWITFSTNTRLEKVAYIEHGWEALEQYGAFDATPYVAAHPFEHLFMFGGAHEMPVDQVIKTGLYMNPPLVPKCGQHLTQFHRGHSRQCWVGAEPVYFPQLEGMELTPFPCGFCERILPTEQAKTQHQSVAHKEELGNLQTGRSLGTSLAEAMSNVPTAAPRAEAEDGPSRAELQTELDSLRQDLEGYIPVVPQEGPTYKELLETVGYLKDEFDKLTAPSVPAADVPEAVTSGKKPNK